MNVPTQVTTHDFRRPSSLPRAVHGRLLEWSQGACQFMADGWREFSHSHLKLDVPDAEMLRMSDARQRFPEGAVGYSCTLSEFDMPTMFVSARSTILSLIAVMLGGSVNDAIEDRDLSAVEQSLSQLWFERFAASMARAYPLADSMVAQLGEMERHPDRTRLFSPAERVVLVEFTVACSFEAAPIYWILAHSELEKRSFGTDFPACDRATDGQTRLERQAEGVPVELVVHLGAAKLTMSELADMSVGDVVVLDQRIRDPLTATIGGVPKFQGWPGRQGVRQVYQIEKLS